jgi:hypothetical protein
VQENGSNGSGRIRHGTALDAWDKCIRYRYWGPVCHVRHYRENGNTPDRKPSGEQVDDNCDQGNVSVCFLEPGSDDWDVLRDRRSQDAHCRVHCVGLADPKRFNNGRDGALKARLVEAALQHSVPTAGPLSSFEDPLNVERNNSGLQHDDLGTFDHTFFARGCPRNGVDEAVGGVSGGVMDVFGAMTIAADGACICTVSDSHRKAARVLTAPVNVESNSAYKKRVFSIRPVRTDTADAPVILVDANVLAADTPVENEEGVVVRWTFHLVP